MAWAMFNPLLLLVTYLVICGKCNSTHISSPYSLRDLSWISSVDRFNPLVKNDNYIYSNNDENKKESNQSYFSSCQRDLFYIERLLTTQFTSLPDWLTSLIDSIGKPTSGLKLGAVLWPGSYEECINGVESTSPGPVFKGRYCSLFWSVKMANNSITAPVNQGICVPSTCNSEQIKNHTELIKDILLFLSPKLRKLFSSHVQLTGAYCHPLNEERSLNTNGKVSLSLLTLMVSVSIATTIGLFVFSEKKDTVYETFSETNINNSTVTVTTATIFPRSSILQELFSCFNIGENLHQLVNGAKSINKNTFEGRHISCFAGIRFFSMAWVILCHSYLFSLSFTNNLVDLLADAKKSLFAFIFILNGSFCVDTFFVLSGALCSYKLFNQHHQQEERTSESSESDEHSNFRYYSGTSSSSFNLFRQVVAFILRCLTRIMRLIPLYLFVLMIDWTLADHASTGPFWDYGDQATSERILCQNSWWYNVLFINNFLPMKQQCMAWTWYLANDFQFFLLTSLILYVIKFLNRFVGLFFLLSTLLICGISTLIVSFVNGLNTGFADLIACDAEKIDPESITPFLDLLYTKPYARIGPYLIGSLLGIILAEKSIYITQQLKRNAKARWCLFLSSISFILIPLTINVNLNPFLAAVYNSLSRICWSIGVSSLTILLYTSAYGRTGCFFESLNAFMSSHIFTPLSNLTYCAYLIHPIIINYFYRSSLTPFIYSPSQIISLFFASITCVYLVSVPLYIFIEAPVGRIFKLITNS